MTNRINLISLLSLTIILFAGPLASGNAFAADKDDKDDKKHPMTLSSFCAKLDDKNSFPALVCAAISDIYFQIHNISLTPGPPGPPGKDGKDGADGAVGPQGPPGPSGTSHISFGTPNKVPVISSGGFSTGTCPAGSVQVGMGTDATIGSFVLCSELIVTP